MTCMLLTALVDRLLVPVTWFLQVVIYFIHYSPHMRQIFI